MIIHRFLESGGVYKLNFMSEPNKLGIELTNRNSDSIEFFTIDKEELHSIIGLLLHIQAKMK